MWVYVTDKHKIPLPKELISFLVTVIENRFEQIIASASTLANIENNHMAKYGNAE